MRNIFLILLLVYSSVAFAGQKYNPFTSKQDYCTTIKEEDGTPNNNFCGDLKVSNGSLTDNGDGTFSMAVGSGTVNSGTANQVGYYATTGTAISGNAGFIFNGTNVGIGTPSPLGKLDVQGSSSSTNIAGGLGAIIQ